MPVPQRRIVVTRALPDPLMNLIRSSHISWFNPEDRTLTASELLAATTDHRADVLLVMAMDRIDAALIRDLPPSVRTIATYSVGHEHIDLASARSRGIAVLHTPDVLSDAVAEMAVLLLLGAARRAHEASALLYTNRWTGWTPTQLIGRDITGARVGIYGMGRIGRTIAHRLARGFDMQVHYHNRSRLAAELEEGATFHQTSQSLLAASEFLILATPSKPETIGFLNAATLAQLPQGAIVVNIARGNLVDDDALIAALRSGHLAAAGLDVFDNEPRIHEGYKTLPNVFLQPHQGSSTLGTRMRMGQLLLDSVEGLMAGRPVSNRLA
jgi:lactate dehydrogenase-like 2-hydroxyacid dehydrogenase